MRVGPQVSLEGRLRRAAALPRTQRFEKAGARPVAGEPILRIAKWTHLERKAAASNAAVESIAQLC